MTQQERESIWNDFLIARGIEPGYNIVCKKCGGLGRFCYSDTSTWLGGVGGQQMTSDVCDKCWGSGKEDEPGADLKRMNSMIKFYKERVDALQKYQKELPEPYRTEVCNILANGKPRLLDKEA